MTSLNKQQQSASLATRGISLVIAGAGTGKTKTLVEKVKNIIISGIANPDEILILTFSNKAAQEIKDRVNPGVTENTRDIHSGTFHSFCLTILKNNSRTFLSSTGFATFPSILGQEEKNRLLISLLIENKARFSGVPVDLVSGLLEKKNLDKVIQDKLNRLGFVKELESFEQKFRLYKIANNLMDFNDIVRFAIDILSGNSSVREQTITKYRYLLIDEFQDASEENLKLINLLLDKRYPNLFLVGDDWQSIYGFRGSRVDYIVNLKKYFPDAFVYKLSRNYRSKKEIIKISNNLIKKNKYRTGKKLKSERGSGGIVKGYCVKSFEEEAQVIRNILINNTNLNDTALLYRNNWQKNYLEEVLGAESRIVNSVKYMTIHSSKGLEFNTVIIAGISDKIIPDASSDIEEERRLLYVALTRAKNNLHIIHHKSTDGELSLFAEELGLHKY